MMKRYIIKAAVKGKKYYSLPIMANSKKEAEDYCESVEGRKLEILFPGYRVSEDTLEITDIITE